ncbi:uncharacterized protein LOC111259996 [Varroa jacobsoni]|uniref:uncharacterized protein LOC111259996 n=1 Tax=Varroa jacobsoni TaxID=62625 RepID=UPI000BF71166|nr:uncharacterized protein LOC111259996 [Varroa jacobsoni]XP_022688151.1 uncharacterized protein LOC111259996 [Varroa jacobsoni]
MSNWHRPLTRIYNDNHKFGTSLYSGALDDIDKRYKSPIRNTSLRDRSDLPSPITCSAGLATKAASSPGRRERPASMYDEPTSSSSVFEREFHQMNSKSTWDLHESRLQVDKNTAQVHAKKTAPHSIITNCKYMDSIFVGPRGFRIFY